MMQKLRGYISRIHASEDMSINIRPEQLKITHSYLVGQRARIRE